LKRHGVIVHHATVPFLDTLENNRGVRGLNPESARGAYLRMVIPEIETEDEWVLYTDVDVIFQNDPTPQLKEIRPKFLGATSEAIRGDKSFFNSGVMVLNAKNIRLQRDRLYDFVNQNLPQWHGFSCNDQGGLNYFFRGAWDSIDDSLNWKNYWGENAGASIIHYHGNRPFETLKRLIEGVGETERSATRRLIYSEANSRSSLITYNRKYFGYLPRIGSEQSQILNLTQSDNSISFRLLAKPDLDLYRYFKFTVSAAGEIQHEDHIILRGAGEYNYSSPDIEGLSNLPGRTEIVVRGEQMLFIQSSVYCKDRAHTAAKRVLIDTVPTFQPPGNLTSSLPAESLCPEILATYPAAPRKARIWTLPGLAWVIKFVNGNWEITDDLEAVLKYRVELGDVVIKREFNAILEAAGDLPADSDRKSDETIRFGANPTKLVMQKRDGAVADTLISFIAQIAAFRQFFGKEVIISMSKDPTAVELNVMKRLKGIYQILRDKKHSLGIAETVVSSGNGLELRNPTWMVDDLMRAAALSLPDNDQTSSVVFLCAGPSKAREYDWLISSLDTIEVLELGESQEDFNLLSKAAIIIVEDETLAGYLLLARPDACVVHLFQSDVEFDAVTKIATLRNLLYVRIRFPNDPSVGEAEFRSLALICVKKSISKALESTISAGPGKLRAT
jgi:hypothetical protein